MGSATIFVYGTLKRGCRNHSFLQSAEYLGEAWTEPGYSLVDCGTYPGMIWGGEREGVAGEAYRVNATQLEALDRLEDVPHEFERATIRLRDGREAQAYLYCGDTAHLPRCDVPWKEC